MQGILSIVMYNYDCMFHKLTIKQEIQQLLNHLNQKNFSGKLFDEKMLKSMREMEKMVDQKEIFISMFGQHNCGKSTLTNALLGEE